MIRLLFALVCGFVAGAVLVEKKPWQADNISLPVAFLPDGGVYEGKLRRGELVDTGKIIWPHGDSYQGEFKRGLYNGKGTLKTAAFTYEGDFVEGVASGEGSITFIDGRSYKGEVEFMQANGEGEMQSPGETYTGEFQNNRYHGEGERVLFSGEVYKGNFIGGFYHGYGELKNDGDLFYQGDFSKGKFHGTGEYQNRGILYSGEFKAGHFHGQGKYQQEDYEYKGAFVSGVFEGKGRLIRKNGIVYNGEFKQGVFHGKGELYDRGERYTGEFFKGKKHGKGTLFFAEAINGVESIKGEWHQGKLVNSDIAGFEFNIADINEHLLYAQNEKISELLLKIVDDNPEKIDTYFLGIAADGEQDIAVRDVEFAHVKFDAHFGTQKRAAILANGKRIYKQYPLATGSSIKDLIKVVSAKMDKEEDILAILLSGNSQTGELMTRQPGLTLKPLSIKLLAEAINSSAVKHKIIIIHGCDSGQFIKPLKSDSNLLIVSHSQATPQENCEQKTQNSFFLKTLFDSEHFALGEIDKAFEEARQLTLEEEEAQGLEFSEPKIFKPKAALSHLQKRLEQNTQNSGNILEQEQTAKR